MQCCFGGKNQCAEAMKLLPLLIVTIVRVSPIVVAVGAVLGWFPTGRGSAREPLRPVPRK